MRPKVLILTRENLLHWAAFYVEAFRSQADTLVAGPPLDTAALERHGLAPLIAYRTPSDVVAESTDVCVLVGTLPPGWRPDLVVGIQSGDTRFQNVARLGCPTAYISVDTWHAPAELYVAASYDAVFSAQQVFPPYFLAGGCSMPHWLPLACAPQYHRPVQAEEDHDVIFVGTTRYVVNEQRVRRLERMGAHYKVGVMTSAGPDDMCATYARGRIGFNSSIAQDVNMRVFEVLGMGRPLLTNRDARVNGLFDLFSEGEELITYDDADLIEVVGRWLGDDAARRALGKRGYQAAIARHTYAHRAQSLLETMAPLVEESRAAERPLLRNGEKLAHYLYPGARRVVDIGLGLDRSRYAYRKQGIRELIGVSNHGGARTQRAGSYDIMLPWPIGAGAFSGVDQVLWSAPGSYQPDLDSALVLLHGWIRDGGVLVFRFMPSEFESTGMGNDDEAWAHWLGTQGFHLLYMAPPGPGQQWAIVVARRYSRGLEEMTQEIYQRFPGGQLSKPA